MGKTSNKSKATTHKASKLRAKKKVEQPAVDDSPTTKADPADPVDILDADCMAHVLSFLWDCNKADPSKYHEKLGVAVVPAMIFFFDDFARVSFKWACLMKKVAARIVSDGHLDFDAIPEEWVGYCASWLCRSKLPLKTMGCTSTAQHVTAARVLQNCNTIQTKYIQLGLSLPDTSSQNHPYLIGNGISGSTQDFVQEVVVAECPNLDELVLFLTVGEGNDARLEEGINSSLLSSSNLHVLSLYLFWTPHDNGFDGSFFSRVIQNLPSLAFLSLHCGHPTLVAPEEQGGAFHIASPSLQQLWVEEFCYRRVLLSLDCPQLNDFRFMGIAESNSSIRVRQKVIRAANVPPHCKASVVNLRGYT